jgi:hypothetical protein
VSLPAQHSQCSKLGRVSINPVLEMRLIDVRFRSKTTLIPRCRERDGPDSDIVSLSGSPRSTPGSRNKPDAIGYDQKLSARSTHGGNGKTIWRAEPT